MKAAPRNFNSARLKEYENRHYNKSVAQLVVKLESIFTTPDKIFLQQEDDPTVNPNQFG